MIFKEMEGILFLNQQNKRVFIAQGFEEIFLQVIDKLCTQYIVPFTD